MTASSHGIHSSGLVNSRNARLIQQHDMTSSMFIDRGLFNKPGENNCFLNSAIQVLWHIDVFRRSFRELNGHYCVGDSCIFCALKVIFTQYQYTSESAIPPNALRSALATCFKTQHKFQLGLMEDASECYEEILGQMHFHLTGNHDDDTCDIPHCISHQKFALTLLERTKCRCGATSEPLPMVQFIHYYSVTALLEEFNKAKGLNQSVEKDPKLFSTMLHNAYCIDNNRECPNYLNCHQAVRPAQILLNALDVVCIGLIWDSDQPTVKLIQLLSDAIGLEIKLSSLFDQILMEETKARAYHLTAVITYYGKHYSTFCYHGKHQEWVYLDDANVRKVGKKWSDVKELFKKGHYQPLLLLYTCPSATPIDASTALTTDIVTMETTSPNPTTITTTTADAVDMTTVATTDQSELYTNATPTDNLIVGVSGHGNTAQSHLPAKDAIVPALPPPPHVDRTHHNNMVTNAMLPATRSSLRVSPTPVDNTPSAPPKGTSPVYNADSNNESEDLMTFESVSTQLIAAANHNPFPTHKLHPSNMLTNEILPLSATNQPLVHSSGGQASIFHSRVNATTTNSNPQTSEGDLIVLDTLKATDMMKMKQKSLALNHLTGLFEQDMIVVDRNHSSTAVNDTSNINHSSSVVVVPSTAMDDKSYPYPRGVTTTNSSTIAVVTSTNMGNISHPPTTGVTTTNHSSSIGVISSTIDDKSHPHPRRVTATNHSSTVTSIAMDDKSHPHPAGLVADRTNQSAAADTNAHHSSPQQHLQSTAMSSHRAANQIQASQLSYRNGFGVSPVDVLCVEAIQMWVKAEMSLAQGDMAVALLAYQQASEILQRAIQDVQVQSNSKRRAQLTSKRNDAIAKADSLKKTMSEKRRHGQTSPQPSYHHQQQYSNAQLCRRCGQIDHKVGSELCGPCELKEKYKM